MLATCKLVPFEFMLVSMPPPKHVLVSAALAGMKLKWEFLKNGAPRDPRDIRDYNGATSSHNPYKNLLFSCFHFLPQYPPHIPCSYRLITGGPSTHPSVLLMKRELLEKDPSIILNKDPTADPHPPKPQKYVK